jgi:cytochrome c55X
MPWPSPLLAASSATLLLAALTAACAGAQAQSQAPSASTNVTTTAASATPNPAAPEQSVAAGRKLYGSYCARCHGVNMVSVGSGFYDLRTFPPDQKERFVQSVKKGIRAMPAWESSLSTEEIDNLWAYVISSPRQ